MFRYKHEVVRLKETHNVRHNFLLQCRQVGEGLSYIEPNDRCEWAWPGQKILNDAAFEELLWHKLTLFKCKFQYNSVF